jgi:flagellar hook-associated protein FlgK
VSGVFGVAVGALSAQADVLARSAQRVARAGDPGAGVDLASERVTQRMASIVYKANAQVIRTADQMLGTLLDLLA